MCNRSCIGFVTKLLRKCNFHWLSRLSHVLVSEAHECSHKRAKTAPTTGNETRRCRQRLGRRNGTKFLKNEDKRRVTTHAVYQLYTYLRNVPCWSSARDASRIGCTATCWATRATFYDRLNVTLCSFRRWPPHTVHSSIFVEVRATARPVYSFFPWLYPASFATLRALQNSACFAD